MEISLLILLCIIAFIFIGRHIWFIFSEGKKYESISPSIDISQDHIFPLNHTHTHFSYAVILIEAILCFALSFIAVCSIKIFYFERNPQDDIQDILILSGLVAMLPFFFVAKYSINHSKFIKSQNDKFFKKEIMFKKEGIFISPFLEHLYWARIHRKELNYIKIPWTNIREWRVEKDTARFNNNYYLVHLHNGSSKFFNRKFFKSKENEFIDRLSKYDVKIIMKDVLR